MDSRHIHQLFDKMEDQKISQTYDALIYKSKKNKFLPQSPADTAKKSDISSRKGLKGAKRGQANDVSVSPLFQQEKSVNGRLDSLSNSSASGDEYRTLRRKYLMLEEESFGLGKELMEVEDDVKALEEEKLFLLDKLVVLEGLVDPSEIHPQPQKLP